MVNFSGLTKLERLHLGRTQITNAGLEPLKPLASLKYLNIRDSNVTTEGVKSISNAIPKLYVAFRYRQ
jgi:hypothetical protein